MTRSLPAHASAGRLNLSAPLRYIPEAAAGPVPGHDLFRPATADAPARVCVIAEIGVNHDGQLDRALYLVDAARRAGADAVKLQLFDPRHLLSNQARLAEYQQRATASSDSHTSEVADTSGDVFAMLDALMLDADQMLAVKRAAQQLNMRFIVTPFSLEDVQVLEMLDVDAVKIASPDAVNRPLLERTASLGKPMIVSTGTCDLEELHFVAELLRGHDAGGCLLQCVSSYPALPEHAALGAMRVLAERFGLPVGYSDHTNDATMGALAVAAGACVLEKHLTYNRRAKGPDHAASLDPETFAMYSAIARQAAAVVGPIAKRIQNAEAEVRDVSRQSVCIKRDLPAGHTLSLSDLTLKRPGTGIAPSRLSTLVGRRLRQAVRANDLLRESDLSHERDVA